MNILMENQYWKANLYHRPSCTLQASDKGTKLIDEDGLFALVAAAPETATAGAKQEVKADAASSVAAIPAGNFYAGKSSAANGVQAKKAALSAGSMAASGALQIVEQAGTFHRNWACLNCQWATCLWSSLVGLCGINLTDAHKLSGKA